MSNASFSSIGKRDFSRKVNAALSAQGYEIVGIVAAKADDADIFWSATAYRLIDTRENAAFIRSFAQVKALAACPRKGAPAWRLAELGLAA